MPGIYLDDLDLRILGMLQRDSSISIKLPASKLRGMNGAFPSSRVPTGLRRKRRGIRPEEIEVLDNLPVLHDVEAIGGWRREAKILFNHDDGVTPRLEHQDHPRRWLGSSSLALIRGTNQTECRDFSALVEPIKQRPRIKLTLRQRTRD